MNVTTEHYIRVFEDDNRNIPFCYSCHYPLENLHEGHQTTDYFWRHYKCNKCGRLSYTTVNYGDYDYKEFIGK